MESLHDTFESLQNDVGEQSDASDTSDYLPDSRERELVPMESDEVEQGQVESLPG